MHESLPSFDELLQKINSVGGSDLHLKVGSPPSFRIDGVVHRSELATVTQADTQRYLDEIITEQAREAFEAYLTATGEVGSPVQPLDLLAVEALRALERTSEAEAILETYGSQLDAARSALGNDLEARMIQRALNLGGDQP